MVSLLLPQKTTTVLTHHEHKENDVVEEPVDVEDKALTCKGKFHELEKKSLVVQILRVLFLTTLLNFRYSIYRGRKCETLQIRLPI